MALTKAARNKISTLVQQAKRALFDEVTSQLAQYYGIRPDGKVLAVEELPSNDAGILHTAALLRQRLDYLKANIPDARKRPREGFEQLVREQAFTILNRFASLRLAEERGIIRESIRQGYNSEGFLVFDQLTGGAKTASQYHRYRWYLYALFDELALGLPSVFSRFSPYALLFPGEDALLQLLALINDEALAIHREEGLQPVNLWQEDETIGWMYQYYNSREEITAMRDASNAPRNSRELAVRNQFFTPRYVVQFLTDNSLGRIWYEMTKGQTGLVGFCEYLVRQPDEVFLEEGALRQAQGDTFPSTSSGRSDKLGVKDGESGRVGEGEIESLGDGEPAIKQSNDQTIYIEHRPLKDPRDITMIDPACGSMHFGLYAFDLYEKIYLEAWDNYPELLQDLREKMTRQEFERLIPSLIIRYNIHGVDIDPRAVQIAGLSLWLRAQRSYQRLGLQPAERPPITKANLVCAEPMPGDKELLEDFLNTVDAPLRPLIRTIWDKMQLAGETGLLLKIEEELKSVIAQAKEEWAKYQNVKGVQGSLFQENAPSIQLEFDQLKLYKRLKADFFEQAEELVLQALERYAETTANGEAYSRQLFAEDTAEGFAFIDLCRKKYDAVLMNPPFGSASETTIKILRSTYQYYSGNILCSFLERALSLITDFGNIGIIHDRVVNMNSSYSDFRKNLVCGKILALADTGWGVLEANVETTTMIISKHRQKKGIFIDLLESKEKNFLLKKSIKNPNLGKVYFADSQDFIRLPNSIYGYNLESYMLKLFSSMKTIDEKGLTARQGHALAAVEHFRLFWELLEFEKFKHLFNGSNHSMFYIPYRDLVIYGNNGYYVRQHRSLRWSNADYQLTQGLGYGRRGEILDVQILKRGMIFTSVGLAIPDLNEKDALELCSYLNSILGQFTINLYSLQHKQAGYLNLLPFPTCDEEESDCLIQLSSEIISLKRYWFVKDETSLEYRNFLNDFVGQTSLSKAFMSLKEKLLKDTKNYEKLIKENDDFWLRKAKIPIKAYPLFEKYKKKRPQEHLWFDPIPLENWEQAPSHSYEILQALFGVMFGRWDVRSILDESLIPPFGDIFDPLPFMPEVALKKAPEDYPIAIPDAGILVADTDDERDILRALRSVILLLWKEHADNIERELCDLGQFENLEDFIHDYNGFFDYHLNRYTQSRRIAPIYWPLSTESGSYTIWLYYPQLTDQTLYKVVNDFVDPRLGDIQKQANELQQAGGNPGKALNELRGMEQELLAFKEELLRVAALPYQPNHDDGVLITAAPLHRLFRHSKWQKKTEECWQQLESGEYDWAHLAYSIWPGRVREKCKTDLSMAIAHGLEEVCEVEVKEKGKKGGKKKKPGGGQLEI